MHDTDRNVSLISRRDALGLGAAASLVVANKSWAESSRQGLQSLGYVVAPGQDLDAWSAWAAKVFALQLADQSATTRVFRMDDHVYRLAIDRSAQVPTFGWEVADAGALDAMAARLEAAGVKVARGSRALASQRGVRDLVTFADPAGNALEIFYGPALASSPFKPGRPIAGFKTGPLGLGHVVIQAETSVFEKTSAFYLDLLGFRMSDYMMLESGGVLHFMHINPREHSFAVGPGPKNMLHHIMMEMQFLDDVGQSYDVAFRDYRSTIALTIGRHTNDLMTSFYSHTPSGFMMECGWGGLLVDSEHWKAGELIPGGDIWGHHPMKDGIEEPRPPLASGVVLRAPLQVEGKNFEVGHHPTELAQVVKTVRSS